MVASAIFSLLIWLLGPVSTFLGGALIVFWLVRELKEGEYRPKYSDSDLVPALEGVVPKADIQREREDFAAILDDERQALNQEGDQ